jgi:hypothetical protein
VIASINDMRLKTRLASAAAATAMTALMLISVGVGFPRLAAAAETAGDVRVRVPDTAAAAAAKELLERAGRALLTRLEGERISDVWVYPTGDANVVFVSYKAGETTHLAFIEMRDAEIASLQDIDAPETLTAEVLNPPRR